MISHRIHECQFLGVLTSRVCRALEGEDVDDSHDRDSQSKNTNHENEAQSHALRKRQLQSPDGWLGQDDKKQISGRYESVCSSTGRGRVVALLWQEAQAPLWILMAVLSRLMSQIIPAQDGITTGGVYDNVVLVG